MKAGFAEIDITPVSGMLKIGWLKEVVGERVLDPLYARTAVFDNGSGKIGFIQLDLLCVRWTQVDRIRKRITAELGFPGECLMVSATHNHAGPAVANLGDVVRDEGYIAKLEDWCVAGFEAAIKDVSEVEIGFGCSVETGLAFNRRMIMRDGTVKTQVAVSTDALCPEGPADPEVGLLAVRDRQNRAVKGCIVNFTCHPVHHGGENVFSAGYPGVLASVMKKRGCPVTLFLNGACGNVIYSDYLNPCVSHSKETLGKRLADRVMLMVSELEWRDNAVIHAVSKTLQLPFREPTEDQVKGTAVGAQRFVDPAIYDRGMPALCERIRTRGTNPAEVQALFMDKHAWVGIPAEYFVEHGLRIKEHARPVRVWITGHANGMVGYVPTRHAFERGGYETTFAGSSKLAPEAGDILADTAIELLKYNTAPVP